MILGENGEKMSKSRGNVVNPDDIVNEYGADTMRIYEMFIGDFEKSAPWNTAGIKGARRFLDRYNAFCDIVSTDSVGIRKDLESEFHKTIKKVTHDIENLKFNTAIAALMSLMNVINDTKSITKDELKIFTQLLNPFAPHITEEVWEKFELGEGFASISAWPKYDESKCKSVSVEIVIQVNGKIRAKETVSVGISKDEVLGLAKEKISDHISGKNIVKEIYVPGKLVNIVVK